MFTYICLVLAVLMVIDAIVYRHLVFKPEFHSANLQLFSRCVVIPYSSAYLLYKYWKFKKENKE